MILCELNFRTGDSRGFAFVRYKYADEAQKAVERLDGKFCCSVALVITCNCCLDVVFYD